MEELNQNSSFEKKIETICSFNNVSCSFEKGKIFNVDKTNISFIEPHKIYINIKNKKIMLIYFNEDNLFLYNRTMPITTKQLDTLLKEIKKDLN